jgi:hypothetical protein
LQPDFAIAKPAARENCIADVAATGEAGFAASYRDSETFWLNERPAAPVLEFPLDRYTDRTPVATPVQFKWLTTEDADAPGMDLVYRHCVWEYGAERDFNNCVEIEKGDAGGGITLPGGHVVDVDEGLRVAGIVALIGFLIFLLCVFFLLRGRYWPLAIVALLIPLAIICAFFAAGLKRGGAMNGVMIRDMNLEQGKDYYWNVVVEDADGGIVHSELRRFEVQ